MLALQVCTDESFSYSPLMDNLCVQFVEKMCHSWHIKGSPCNLRNADSPCYRLASQLAPIHLIRLDRDIKGCCLLERQAGCELLANCKVIGVKSFTFCYLFIQKILQKWLWSMIISIIWYFAYCAGYSFWDRLRNFLQKFTWIFLSVHKLNKLGKFC